MEGVSEKELDMQAGMWGVSDRYGGCTSATKHEM